jgi:acetolactate synthase-1/2/3 large subunit
MRGFIKASDYVAEWLKTKVDHVFAVQGGAVVHLLDSCSRLGPTPIYCHHEQAAAFAAGAYARVKGYGVCISTTGPGSTNAITPCLGAWQDSIPMMFISGQQRVNSYGTSNRQSASQEAPILDIVEPFTKFQGYVDQADLLPEILEDAYRASMTGRKGPAWVDVIQDVSWQIL